MGLIDKILGREEVIEVIGIDGQVLGRAALSEVDGLFDQLIPQWYGENLGTAMPATSYGSARLSERVWVANRCQQMNAQQIASMPVQFHGPDGQEPAWVSSPDPEYFPNGIGDAVHYGIEQMYGWGYAILYVTDFYSTGYPRLWTVLPSCDVTPKLKDGVKVYQTPGGGYLDAGRIVQIDRNPSKVHGTSALRAYGDLAFGLITAQQQARAVNDGGKPSFYLQSKRPLNEAQALALQQKWAQRIAERGGLPPVLPPEIEAKEMSFDPASLSLLENQEFGARAIATAYGVPSVLLNMALQGGLTYQNPGALGEMWWRFELRPTATRLANALSEQMLPRGSFISFKASDTFAALDANSPEDDEQAADTQPQLIDGLVPTPAKTPPAPKLAAIN